MIQSVPSMLRRPLFATALLLVTGGVALAQPAQEGPKNLKVLPKDWTRAQVINVMEAFTAALGVGCNHCHVQKQGSPPDFASDDKEEKNKARAMLKITRDLNARLPMDFGEPASELTRIQCITCHRGVPEPKQLGEILAKTSAEKGFPAAKAQYMDLKSKYYGSQAYDFSENGLIATARPLVRNRADEAVEFLEFNLEMFPKSAESYVLLAEAQVTKNDKAGAIKSLETALQIDPRNFGARRALNQLKGQ